MTVNEPEYQGDASLLGDRALGIWLNDDGNFYYATYTHKYNFGSDNVDRWTTIDHGDDLKNDWIWLYYGYNPEENKAIAYARFRDREV